MKIIILAIGTFGDVYPYAALAQGLQNAGYQVTLATHQPYRDFVAGKGLSYAQIAGDPVQWEQEHKLSELVSSSRNFTGWMNKLKELADNLIPVIFASCLEACHDMDAVVYSPLAWIGYSISEKFKVPGISASLQPFLTTRSFSSPWLSAVINTGIFNRLTHTLVMQLYWQFNRYYVNHFRKEVLDLPEIRRLGPFGSSQWNNQLFLFGFSQYLIPKPEDWPANAHITGFWRFDADACYHPPEDLLDFISAGPKPVYLGFGSMPGNDNENLLDIADTAFKKAGVRGVAQIKTGNAPGKLSPNLFNAGWINHDWLFENSSAVICHGGVSTLATSLRFGTPIITIPHAWDQSFWGKRIEKAGLGISPCSRINLTSSRLARAISEILNNPRYRNRSSEAAGKIKNENGIGTSVGLIDRALISREQIPGK